MKTVDFSETIAASDLKVGRCRQLIMPPTLKKLIGHIAFGVCVRGCVRVLHLVSTLAPSFLIGSSSFLQVTRTTIKAWMSSNLSRIPPLTSELAALERLKKRHIILLAL